MSKLFKSIFAHKTPRGKTERLCQLKYFRNLPVNVEARLNHGSPQSEHIKVNNSIGNDISYRRKQWHRIYSLHLPYSTAPHLKCVLRARSGLIRPPKRSEWTRNSVHIWTAIIDNAFVSGSSRAASKALSYAFDWTNRSKLWQQIEKYLRNNFNRLGLLRSLRNPKINRFEGNVEINLRQPTTYKQTANIHSKQDSW